MTRLGRTQSGIQGIKNHHWFAGFDWDGFDKQSLVVLIVPTLPSDLKRLGKVMDQSFYIQVNSAPHSDWWPDLTLDRGSIRH